MFRIIFLFCFVFSLLVSNSIYIFPKSNKNNRTISIVACGDIMLGSGYPDDSYLAKDSGTYLLKNVKSIIKNADLAFGNLESCIAIKNYKSKQCYDPKVCYAFRQTPKSAQILKETGFDVLSIANNHSNDFGEIGLQETQYYLKENNLNFAGLASCPYDTFDINGFKIGFTAFSANDYTLNINDTNLLKSIVQKLDSICDIVIVSFHGGGEGSKFRNVKNETEIFLDENRGNVYQFAHTAIDAGADLVLGHGPHVVRAIELYKNKLIAYSLGNFCTYKQFNLSSYNSSSPILHVNLDSQGNFYNGMVHSFKQKRPGGPFWDQNQKAFNEIKELSEIDFPYNNLIFKENGLIEIKKGN